MLYIYCSIVEVNYVGARLNKRYHQTITPYLKYRAVSSPPMQSSTSSSEYCCRHQQHQPSSPSFHRYSQGRKTQPLPPHSDRYMETQKDPRRTGRPRRPSGWTATSRGATQGGLPAGYIRRPGSEGCRGGRGWGRRGERRGSGVAGGS